MADEKVIVRLELDKRDLKKVTSDSTSTFEEAGEKSGKSFSTGFKAAILGGAVAVGLFAKNALSAAGTLEDINAQFTVFLKNEQLALQLTKQLSTFAASTPFQLEGIAASAKVLIAFGEPVENITDRLKTLGDIAAGSGKPLKDLAVIFGQIKGAGKLTGERLNQLQEAGVNVIPALTKITGIIGTDLRDAVSKSKVSFDDVDKALQSMAAEGGLFFDGMKKKSETLNGKISTLSDNFFAFSATIGNILLPFAKQLVDSLSNMLKSFTENETKVRELANAMIFLGRVINNSIVAPLELLKNIVKASFDAIVVDVQKTVVALAGTFSNLIDRLPNSIVPEGWKQGFRDFADSSTQVLDNLVTNATESVGGIFESDAFISIDELLNNLEYSVNNSAGLVKGAVETTTTQIGGLVDETKKSAVDLAKVFSQSLAKGISGGVQTITKALISGEQVFSSFAKFALNAMGEMAVQLGEIFILEGIAMEAFKSLSGGQAIAAGIALVALGTVAKAYSGEGGGLSGAASGGAAGATIPTGETFSDSTLEEQEERRPEISINIQGDVLDSEESGMRIVELINKSVDDSSVQIRQQAFA